MSTTVRRVIDVSKLPPSALDHRSPIWIGNALLLTIETVMFAVLVASYFYIRYNFGNWPPPQPNFLPPNFDPIPDVFWGTLNSVIIIAAAFAMSVASEAAKWFKRERVLVFTGTTVTLAIVAMVLRAYELHGTKFRWDDNAYASVVWGILIMHLIHLIVGCLEDAMMLVYIMVYGLDDKHARDVRVTAVYWYWIAAIWMPLYVIVYFCPYWL